MLSISYSFWGEHCRFVKDTVAKSNMPSGGVTKVKWLKPTKFQCNAICHKNVYGIGSKYLPTIAKVNVTCFVFILNS